MREIEGVECTSTKSCMRELLRNGYIAEDELKKLLQMVDDRNLTVYTYREKLAKELFGRLEGYANLLRTVKGSLVKSLE